MREVMHFNCFLEKDMHAYIITLHGERDSVIAEERNSHEKE